MDRSPYIASNWSANTRFARIVDHCKTVAEIGGIVEFAPSQIVELMQLTVIGPKYRLCLEQPRWVPNEAQLSLSPVVEIRAVSESNYPQRKNNVAARLSFGEVWRDRDGVYNG